MTNGSATITGVDFEAWFVALKLVDVIFKEDIKVKYQARTYRDNKTGKLSITSIDDICIYSNDKTEFYNLKYRAPNIKTWSVKSLKNYKVLDQFKNQFKKTPDAYLYFVTESPCPIFQEVLPRGSSCKSRKELEITLNSNNYIKQWVALKIELKMNDKEMIKFSNQVKFKRIIDIDEIKKLIIHNLERRFTKIKFLPNCLYQLAIESGKRNKEITRDHIISHLEKNDIYFLPSLTNRIHTKKNSNLPQREKFIDRETEKEKLLKVLKKNIPNICIEGMPGIGKSDLAIACGRIALEKGLFDYVIWNNNFDGKLELNEVLDQVCLQTNKIHALRLPLLKKKIFVNDQLRSNKYLVVVDNFETVKDYQIEQYAINCPNPSKFLFTSKEKKPNNSYAFPIYPFEYRDDAIKLLQYWLHQTNGKEKYTNKKFLNQLAEKTGKNPLAMKWAINQITRLGSSIELVISDLNKGRGDIFSILFQRAWTKLSNSSKILLEVIAFIPAPTKIDSLQKISNLYKQESEKAIKELTALCLIEPNIEISEKNRRYNLHSLTRAFAKNELFKNKDLLQKIREETISHWLKYSEGLGGMKWNWGGYNLLIREIENIFHAIDLCIKLKRWDDVILFRDYLSNALSIRGYWRKRIELARLAIKAVEKKGNFGKKAQILVYDIAYVELKIGELKNAENNTKKGLEIFQKGNNFGISQKDKNLGIAAAYHHLGKIKQKHKNYQTARKYFKDSLDLYKVDKEYEPFLISELATIYFEDEKYGYDKAKKEFKKALNKTKGKSGKCEIVVARCLGYLGEIQKINNEFDEAIKNIREALNIAQKIGRADEIALNAFRLADIFHSKNNKEGALLLAEEALSTYHQMGDNKHENKVKKFISKISKNSVD